MSNPLWRYPSAKMPNGALSVLPPMLHRPLARYAEIGAPPSAGLRALLEGNVYQAARVGDHFLVMHLPELVSWILGALPEESYGNPRRVSDWINSGGAAANRGTP